MNPYQPPGPYSGLSEGMGMIGDFILIAITLAIGVLALLPGSQAYAKKQP